MQGPQTSLLADGRRLHLHHGPIDLIIEAFGDQEEVERAYAQASRRFQSVLEELVEELPALRTPLGPELPDLKSRVACAMRDATAPLRPQFITPMAAVAGAVADEVLGSLTEDRRLQRAYVNNGGDVAFFLAEGEELTTAVFGTTAKVTLNAAGPSRGLATSGWRGRSCSLGIADSVTVLAATSAIADAAATLIANAVDLPRHGAIERAPASSVDPDSELGDQLVTIEVGALTRGEARAALFGGRIAADALIERRLIHGAALFLQGESVFCPSGLFPNGTSAGEG